MTYLPELTTMSAFGLGLVTVRVGMAMVILPFFGNSSVNSTVRVSFALFIALIIYPTMADQFPAPPASGFGIAQMVLIEAAAGIFFGMVAKFLVATLHIAGSMISTQSALASATLFDPNQGGQNSIEGNFLTMVALTLLLAFDVHHVMLSGLAQSYRLIPVNGAVPITDMSQAMVQIMNQMFLVAFKIAAPNIVVNLLLFIGSGILSRLMPAMQIFFVILPGQIMIAFIVLMLTFGTAMLWYSEHVTSVLTHWAIE